MGPVVQVALEPSPLDIAGRHDTRTRRGEVGQASLQLGVQSMQLGLVKLALSDVLRRAEHPKRRARLVSHDPPAAGDPAHRAVRQRYPVLDGERGPVGVRLPDGPRDDSSIVRMDRGKVRLIVDLPRSRLAPPQAIHLVRPDDPVRGHVPLPAADVRERLSLREPRLLKPALADVAVDDHLADHTAGCVADRRGRDGHVDERPVLAPAHGLEVAQDLPPTKPGD